MTSRYVTLPAPWLLLLLLQVQRVTCELNSGNDYSSLMSLTSERNSMVQMATETGIYGR